jgi:hypothetical protein
MSKIKSVSSSGSKQLLTITAQKGQYLSKLVDKDCNVVESYSKCYELNFHVLEYSNFHEVLKEIFEYKETAFLLGGATYQPGLNKLYTAECTLKNRRA